MASSDHRGLFAPVAAPSSPTAASTAAGQARRVKLYWYDAVAAQVLNPYGETNFTEQSTETVWRAASKGSKKVAFHTELASDEEWRQGVGISRSAEALLSAIKILGSEDMKKLIKDEPLNAALAEAAELKPHLENLHRGKGSQEGAQQPTLAQLKKRKVDQEPATAPCTDAEVQASAIVVHKWLKKEVTPLRAMLAFMAGNGAFFAGHVAEKTCRAAVQHKPLDQAAWAAAAVKRNKSKEAPRADGTGAADTRGLFE